MTYLIDTSAIWHLYRNPPALKRWDEIINAGLIRLCPSTRIEFLRSAESSFHRDEMAERLDILFPSIAMPKKAWEWSENAQYKLTQKGQHRAPGAMDLLLCAAAVHHNMIVLHVDNDFKTVASVLPEVQQLDIRR